MLEEETMWYYNKQFINDTN